MKRIILLGATGSIGGSACDIVRARPDDFKVVALAARSNLAAAEHLVREFGAKVYVGEDAALRAVQENDADLVLVATVGLSGLAPTMAAIGKGMSVALATKEVLVAAGEIVEARWLFGVPAERIDVVVHPESIVHSLVEFSDGATLAQLSPPDMHVPIQYAMSWPERLPAERARLDLPSIAALTFRKPDERRFPALRLVKEIAACGGTRMAALSAADEVAVGRFLAGEIRFADIVRLVEDVTGKVAQLERPTVEAVFEADREARSLARVWTR